MREIKRTDFSNQDFHIGIDVHKKNWLITIRNNQMELRTFSMNPSPEELHQHMQRYYPGGRYISAYEAGFCSFWIHRNLQELGIKSIVIHAADIPSTNKERSTKTDKVDSHKIARELEKKSLNSIYVPNEFHQQRPTTLVGFVELGFFAKKCKRSGLILMEGSNCFCLLCFSMERLCRR